MLRQRTKGFLELTLSPPSNLISTAYFSAERGKGTGKRKEIHLTYTDRKKKAFKKKKTVQSVKSGRKCKQEAKIACPLLQITVSSSLSKIILGAQIYPDSSLPIYSAFLNSKLLTAHTDTNQIFSYECMS